jgi:hypothetical protein
MFLHPVGIRRNAKGVTTTVGCVKLSTIMIQHQKCTTNWKSTGIVFKE